MNQIDVSQIVDPNTEQPFTGPSVSFWQSANIDALKAAVLAMIGDYTTGQVVVLDGMVNTGVGGAYIISAGHVYYNGEIYAVDAFSCGVPGGGQAVIGTVTVTNPSPDPVLFSDNTSKNVHNVRKVVLSLAASGGGIGNYDFYRFMTSIRIFTELTNITGIVIAAPTGFVVVPSLTYTTPNDGYTRTYEVDFRTNVSFNNTTSDVSFRIQDTTNVVTYDQTTMSFNGAVVFAAVGATLKRKLTLAPNTTFRIEYSSVAAGLGITATYMIMTVKQVR